MKILELNIKDDLDKRVSWDEIAKKYGVGKSKIQKIKQHGCWYVDLVNLWIGYQKIIIEE